MEKEQKELDGKNLTLETLQKHEGKLTIAGLKSVTGKLKDKARVVVLLRLAHSLAKANGYAKTGFHATADEGDETFVRDEKSGKWVAKKAKEGEYLYDKDGQPVLTTAYANGYMNAHTKPTGGFWTLDEKSELFEGILNAAKEAAPDVAAGKYSEKVREVLELQLITAEAGSRKRDYSQANDLW